MVTELVLRPFKHDALISYTQSGNLVTLIPIMQAEISPPASRGFLVAQHGKKHLQTPITLADIIRGCSRWWLYDSWMGWVCLLFCNKRKLPVEIPSCAGVPLATPNTNGYLLDSGVPTMA